jgi:molecular chaperone GrpE
MLAIKSNSARIAGKVAARSPARATLFNAPVSKQQQKRNLFVVKAEETSEAVKEEAPTSASQSPLERAKTALQSETIDKAELEACLAQLEAELGSQQDAVGTANARVVELEAAVTSAKDQFLRLNADFDNFRRRTANEKDAMKDSIRGDLIMDLLPLIDNFELARTQVKAETESEIKINNAYQGLYKQMVDILRSLKVETVPTVGSIFDPAIHDAIMREPNDELPDGSVLMEFRKGFKIGDKLIRPAMVKVSFTENPGASMASGDEEPGKEGSQ